MNIDKLVNLKNKNKEWAFAMVQYALYQLSLLSLINKSELSDDMLQAVENTIAHYKADYDKYSPLLKWNSEYKPGLKQ